jgi:hypothetical protein
MRDGMPVIACGVVGGFIALWVAASLLFPEPTPWRFYAGLGLVEREVAVDPATGERAWKVTHINQDGAAGDSYFVPPDTEMAPDGAVVPGPHPFPPVMEFGLGFPIGMLVGMVSLRFLRQEWWTLEPSG